MATLVITKLLNINHFSFKNTCTYFSVEIRDLKQTNLNNLYPHKDLNPETNTYKFLSRLNFYPLKSAVTNRTTFSKIYFQFNHSSTFLFISI